jgi:hypothetical protein
MYEIKKIHSQSLSNYLAVITAVTVFIFGLINFVINMLGSRRFNMQISWQDQLVSWFVSVIVFYVIAWAIGYLFSIIYNFLASHGRGIVISLKSIDISSPKENQQEKLEDKKDNFVV